MSAEKLLQRLDKVKQVGPSKWLAGCPSHEDRTPSLSVRELDDGTVLMHCFGGCGAAEILESLGLDFSELFPPKTDKHFSPKTRKPWNASDILQALAVESLIVQVYANMMSNGEQLTADDRQRLLLSASRLQRGAEIAHEFI